VTDLTAGRDDGWGVTDEYDIATFYTRAADGRGHSENLRVRVKPELSGEVSALVASGRIPDYSTPQDFIRDAIVHRLRWLAENADDPILAAKLAETIRRAIIDETTARYTALIDSFEEFIVRTKEVCDRALRFDDHAGVAGYLDDVVAYAENTREPYAGMLMKTVAHYRSLLKVVDELPAEYGIDGGLGPEDES
jgi:hypothetical protein